MGVVCVLKPATVKKEFFELKRRILSAMFVNIPHKPQKQEQSKRNSDVSVEGKLPAANKQWNVVSSYLFCPPVQE